jgi:hypothetical protein
LSAFASRAEEQHEKSQSFSMLKLRFEGPELRVCTARADLRCIVRNFLPSSSETCRANTATASPTDPSTLSALEIEASYFTDVFLRKVKYPRNPRCLENRLTDGALLPRNIILEAE